MKIKCIGGTCDGEVIKIDNHYKTGDYIQVRRSAKYKISNFKEDLKAFREGKYPSGMYAQYYIYKIVSLSFDKDDHNDKMLFLIPENWSYKKAIIHQFDK